MNSASAPASIPGVSRQSGSEFGERRGSGSGEAPQHRIDEARIAGMAAIGLDEADSEINRGVVRNVEKKQLGRTREQDAFEARRIGGEAPIKRTANQMPQRAEPAQRGGRDPMRKSPVALGKGTPVWIDARSIILLLERPATAQDTVQQIDCGTPHLQQAAAPQLGVTRVIAVTDPGSFILSTRRNPFVLYPERPIATVCRSMPQHSRQFLAIAGAAA